MHINIIHIHNTHTRIYFFNETKKRKEKSMSSKFLGQSKQKHTHTQKSIKNDKKTKQTNVNSTNICLLARILYV